MLPSYSPKGRKRSQQLQLWKRAGLVGGVFILALFLWVQYTILTTNLGGIPAHVGELQGATQQDSQHPDNNEQAHLRGNEHQPQPTAAVGKEEVETDAVNRAAAAGGGSSWS
ncbi:hypothetical protein PF001_g27227 [Phytophthora fragariae]|uniref:Uncharacterized protein n=1 Tax=Phytophthora fragariae TaxID=53985 RepID=A0A6A4BMW9_9STRA|nr:hypothetical protein PF003_g13001 [Phytophthora fragariae]KAE8921469.1 hypothetical protein PF009_g28255 [Phytophthora fragariae]KAE8969849.1 hypothetical protein PF011_g26640 [Phytophthora fragariae]KAE9172774.1 hypothetical protein PF004_g27174 [Phytophthora fragariae]KAE9274064.1 hypothetical protein PF001_g27227 [Phytophthora fragariae]